MASFYSLISIWLVFNFLISISKIKFAKAKDCYFSKKCKIKSDDYKNENKHRIVCYDFNYLFELNHFCGDYQEMGV